MKTKTKRYLAPIAALGLCAALLCGFLAGCGARERERENERKEDDRIVNPVEDTGITLKLYQPDPARAGLWQTLAADYKALSGVTVNVMSPETETPHTELRESLLREEGAPGIFLFTHPREYRGWPERAADLTDTQAYRQLINSRMALMADGKVIGLPVGVDAFGVIYNKKILDKYFALEDAAVASISEINSHAEFSRLVKDLHEKKEELGIEGVFAAPAYKEGESGVWTTRLFSVPLGHELAARRTELTAEEFEEPTWTHARGYRTFHDLMAGHATTKEKLAERTHANAAQEFATGKAALIIGGTEFLGHLNSVEGQTVTAEDVAFLPIMLEMENETGRQGLAFDVTEYAAVNARLGEEDRRAAADFLNWLYTSEKGMDFLANKLGVLAPYESQNAATMPNNPLSADAFAWLKKEDVQNVVTWSSLAGGEEFRDKVLGRGMAAYHAGESGWEEFREGVAKGWNDLRGSWDRMFK